VSKKLIRFLIIISASIFLSAFVEAEANDDVKLDALNQLVEEIQNFYLHPNAADFLTHFYTETSIEHLRLTYHQINELKQSNPETELDLSALYQQLRSAVTNLSPLTIRRGEATAQGQDLNFRSHPAVETQVLYWLPYGTDFEIIEEVWGGGVTDQAGVTNYLWFRIRHDVQAGYVHSRYVRAIPVSDYRIQLITDIAREMLRIQAKIEGWSIEYAPNTRSELQNVLNRTEQLKSENWQFQLSYESLNNLLQQLDITHLNLMTQSRYDLITAIHQLKDEIGENLAGTGMRNDDDYTAESWAQMRVRLDEVQVSLVDDWENDFPEEELQRIYQLLRLAINQLEERPIEIEEVRELSIYQTRIRQWMIGFGIFIGILVIVGILNLINRLKG